MANLFNALGGQRGTPMNSPQNIIQQYKEFRRAFRGDPNQIIQEKLRTGEITQAQIDQAKAMLSQFSQMLK